MQFRPKRLAAYTETDLIEEIRRVVTEEFRGRVPNSQEFKAFSRVSLNSITRHFGSYSIALAKVLFSISMRTHQRGSVD
jgi:hypothetical protein